MIDGIKIISIDKSVDGFEIISIDKSVVVFEIMSIDKSVEGTERQRLEWRSGALFLWSAQCLRIFTLDLSRNGK